MSELQITARFRIHDGHVEHFKTAATACMKSVREKDSGTLQYDWFFNDDHSECVVRERYVDSDALLEHLENLGETMGELLAVSSLFVEIFGRPSEKLVAATEGMGVVVYSYFQGK